MRHIGLLIAAFACGCGGRVLEESPAVETKPTLGDAGSHADASSRVDAGRDVGGVSDASEAGADAGDALAEDSAPPSWDELVRPCLAGGNIIHLNGDPGDYIHPGVETMVGGTWLTPTGAPRYVTLHRDVTWLWSLSFSSEMLGVDLAARSYEDAERAPFASAGHPGLEVSGAGRGCNKISGRFNVHEIAWSDSTLVGFTASFEQHCEKLKPALRGCVHYEL